MKAVILAGGRGTRLSEETSVRPKPLVEAGGKPLIWHIMQNYARFGVDEFIVLAGYMGQQIREYFGNFWLHDSDVTFDLSTSDQLIHQTRGLPWKVSVIETGLETQTGGRLKKVQSLLSEDFLFTYGDGVADVNISELQKRFYDSGKIGTLTAVQPPARFGALTLSNNEVLAFEEKPTGDGAWINGGFFLLSPRIFDLLGDSQCSFEVDVLPKLAEIGELSAYKHDGFWQPVDTVRDLYRLEQSILRGDLPW